MSQDVREPTRRAIRPRDPADALDSTDAALLVYACSGCSSAAQMANHLALRMDREGRAEMSCISGVGGGVPALVKTARSGRPIVALDGCAMACVAHCLKRVGVAADRHLVLGEYGVRKRKHADFDLVEAESVYADFVLPAARELAERASAS